jgi:hypothetical protein
LGWGEPCTAVAAGVVCCAGERMALCTAPCPGPQRVFSNPRQRKGAVCTVHGLPGGECPLCPDSALWTAAAGCRGCWAGDEDCAPQQGRLQVVSPGCQASRCLCCPRPRVCAAGVVVLVEGVGVWKAQGPWTAAAAAGQQQLLTTGGPPGCCPPGGS